MAESDPVRMYLGGAPGTTLKHFAAATAGQLLATGAGAVVSVNINTPAASGSVLTLYDGTSTSGAVMAVIDCTKQTANVGFAGWPFTTGLFVVLTGAPDITLVYW